MKTRSFSLFLFFCPLCLWAQQTYVKVSAEYTDKNEMVLWAENYSHIPHTVTLRFEEVSNTTSAMGGDKRSFVVGTGKRRLMSLRPIDAKRRASARYRAFYELGNTVARPDTAFVYLFPLRPGTLTQCRIMSAIERLPGDDSGRPVGLSLRFREGDTVVAARAGVVTDVNDKARVSQTSGRMFRGTENYVQIYHADGSFALYKYFADAGVLVQPGDNVRPGDPLGIISDGDPSTGGAKLGFMIYTWEEVPSDDPDKMRKRGRPWLPRFWLGEAGEGYPQKSVKYTVEHPEEYVTREMNKKEKKKFVERKEK
ncbi:MAG: M23 family metallopeptidase [Bacteroides sp.]|nr:M23 family metallopeptidase [Bacteroides sp.]